MSNNAYYVIVEQRRNDRFRNEYNPKTNTFEQTESKSLFFEREFSGLYGWLDGYGNPPNKHLDVIVSTNNEYELGDKIKIKIIGVFLRNDKDNKLIGIEQTRYEDELEELPINELNMIKKVYPIIKEKEGWFGKEIAMRVINEYMKNGN